VITPTPATPIATPPYLASQTATRGRPAEPWKDSLRLIMIVFGVMTIAAFATPIATDPMAFNWDAIIHGAGREKLPALTIAAVGFLALVIGAIPMAAGARGAIAAVLGIAGLVIPLALAPVFVWQAAVILVGAVLVLPGLIVRDQYRDAMLPRLLVTLGVLAMMAPLLVPIAGNVPLVGMFKEVIDAEGAQKVPAIVELVLFGVAVLSLLVWLPAPSSGLAKLWAWILILAGAITTIAKLVVIGHLADVVKTSPFAVVAWIPEAAYMAVIAYGLASVFGKQLE
jgi:hypothetical protein